MEFTRKTQFFVIIETKAPYLYINKTFVNIITSSHISITAKLNNLVRVPDAFSHTDLHCN